MIGTIWNTLIKQPITQLLLWLASFTGNLGVAIILLTLVIQLVLTPLRLPSLKSAQKMKLLKPKLDELKEKHADDQMKLAQAQMELYREHGLNPLGGILPTLLSIPIILALYRVLLTTLQNGTAGIATTFLWLDVTRPDPYYILPLIVGGSQWLMTRLMPSPLHTSTEENTPTEKSQDGNRGKTSGSMEEIMQSMQSQMGFVFPVFSALITATLPSGVGLYWIISVWFSTLQQQLSK